MPRKPKKRAAGPKKKQRSNTQDYEFEVGGITLTARKSAGKADKQSHVFKNEGFKLGTDAEGHGYTSRWLMVPTSFISSNGPEGPFRGYARDLRVRFLVTKDSKDSKQWECLSELGNAYLYARALLLDRGHSPDAGSRWGVTMECHPMAKSPELGAAECIDAMEVVQHCEELFELIEDTDSLRHAPSKSRRKIRPWIKSREDAVTWAIDLGCKAGLATAVLLSRSTEQWASLWNKMPKNRQKGRKRSQVVIQQRVKDDAEELLRLYLPRIKAGETPVNARRKALDEWEEYERDIRKGTGEASWKRPADRTARRWLASATEARQQT